MKGPLLKSALVVIGIMVFLEFVLPRFPSHCVPPADEWGAGKRQGAGGDGRFRSGRGRLGVTVRFLARIIHEA